MYGLLIALTLCLIFSNAIATSRAELGPLSTAGSPNKCTGGCQHAHKPGYTQHGGAWVKQPKTKTDCAKMAKAEPGPDDDGVWEWTKGKCVSRCPWGECG
jgi:hypothetical protein